MQAKEWVGIAVGSTEKVQPTTVSQRDSRSALARVLESHHLRQLLPVPRMWPTALAREEARFPCQKSLALCATAGLDAPIYTVTGWPSRDVLPVFGGYADGFWVAHTG
jgi:hypothetical protein